LGIYNVSPSLDFDKDPELDEMMNKPFRVKEMEEEADYQNAGNYCR
jgi:hypothetical protein